MSDVLSLAVDALQKVGVAFALVHESGPPCGHAARAGADRRRAEAGGPLRAWHLAKHALEIRKLGKAVRNGRHTAVRSLAFL